MGYDAYPTRRSNEDGYMPYEVEHRWRKAPKRDSHESVVYQAVVDDDYRKEVLSEAFGG